MGCAASSSGAKSPRGRSSTTQRTRRPGEARAIGADLEATAKTVALHDRDATGSPSSLPTSALRCVARGTSSVPPTICGSRPRRSCSKEFPPSSSARCRPSAGCRSQSGDRFRCEAARRPLSAGLEPRVDCAVLDATTIGVAIFPVRGAPLGDLLGRPPPARAGSPGRADVDREPLALRAARSAT
jgi:hypothetical protein